MGFRCTECGWTGEGGEVEYADGTRLHFRANIEKGKIQSIYCGGRVEEVPDALLAALKEPPDASK